MPKIPDLDLSSDRSKDIQAEKFTIESIIAKIPDKHLHLFQSILANDLNLIRQEISSRMQLQISEELGEINKQKENDKKLNDISDGSN